MGLRCLERPRVDNNARGGHEDPPAASRVGNMYLPIVEHFGITAIREAEEHCLVRMHTSDA